MISTTRAVRRGLILALVCGVQFMVVLDIAIVNVALPSIQIDLGIAQADLQWVVIAYGLALGGFLLLGGRAADLLGRRKVLLAGLTLFTAASLIAGLSTGFGMLLAARGFQGLGSAMMAPAALSILVNTFAEGAERNKALGLFGAVGGSAASVGVVLSGVLTSGPGWEWTFFLNVPVGIAMVVLVLRFVPSTPPSVRQPADVLGAVLVTSGLLSVVYAINHSVSGGWGSGTTLAFLGGGAGLLALFAAVESRVSSPLVPLGVFRRRTFSAANAVAALVFGAFFATIFQASLFMQQVLRYSAVSTGLAYLAMSASAFIAAGAVAARVVDKRGPGFALIIGQAASALGLILLTRTPADAAYWRDVFPGFLAVGIGIGFSGVAVQVAAFIGVEDALSGLAGGMIETSREVGGALGTAIIATVASGRAAEVLTASGPGASAAALTAGFHRGSLVAIGFNVVCLVLAATVLHRAERRGMRVDVPALPSARQHSDQASTKAAPQTAAPLAAEESVG